VFFGEKVAMAVLEETLSQITSLDEGARKKALARLDMLTKPPGSLGRLEELAAHIAAITGRERPQVREKLIVTVAADHGVAKEGVSAYPQEVTAQMVYNFVAAGAGINVLAKRAGARVIVVDAGVAADLSALKKAGKIRDMKIGPGTANIATGPAMSEGDARRCLENGILLARELLTSPETFLGVGDMGIANTTPAAAITSVFTGVAPEEVTGRGTGINDQQLAHKTDVVRRALRVNRPRTKEPLGVLAKVGGYEIGTIAGLILGAASRRVPVFIDGFISTAGALIAFGLSRACGQYMFASHVSQEKGHKFALRHMGLRPILDLGLRLGEGTGAALAMVIAEAALRILNEMATFDEAGVSKKES
jgi:nicotinate-nucleotide--dimethylbenzimidazole phosphoribosyltransferase